jgi:flagellar biosynthesis protein FlhA
MAKEAARLPFNLTQLFRQGDVLLAVGVAIILFVMLIPLPPLFLDLMLTLSISFSMVVLVTAMFVESPLEFSVFPSVVMIATILRLALNVATTRRILLYGDQGSAAAGKVIQAFGFFVVGGNYVIGFVVFLILFALNKMVIAKGMKRIGEVAARFTLDAMPGKQMAIDADLNAGLITEQEAKERREAIRREADFYGAMDGAGNFVEGDVNVGILITLINIIGGFFIGVFQKHMDWLTAAQTYTILTIGDGLVSIIPSLIMSTAAGFIVTRSADKGSLGSVLLEQITISYRALFLVSGVLVAFGIVPGMPTIPFFILSGLIFGLGILSKRYSSELVEEMETEREGEKEKIETPEEVRSLLPLDVLSLEVGYGLIPLVDEQRDGNLLARIRSIRRQLALEMGVVIPSMHVRDNLNLKPNQYVVQIKGNPVASAEVLPDHYLAMDPGTAKKKIKGIQTREPAFNLPAMWITEEQKEEAILAGYTVVDPSTVIATHLTEIFKKHLHEFIGRQETQELLDTLAKRAPKAVEDLVPGILPLGTVQKVLQNLVREGVSIRDMLTIVETLADYGTSIKDAEQLTEFVRQKLGRTIVRPYLDSSNTLRVISLDPSLENLIQEHIRQTDSGTYYLSMPPQLAQRIINAISNAFENIEIKDGHPVLLTGIQIRPHLAKLVTRFIPLLPVISHGEIPPDIKLESITVVRLNNAS